MKKLHAQVIMGDARPSGPSGPPKFRIIATNPQNDSLTMEVGIFDESEMIRTIAAFAEAVAEAHD